MKNSNTKKAYKEDLILRKRDIISTGRPALKFIRDLRDVPKRMVTDNYNKYQNDEYSIQFTLSITIDTSVPTIDG